MSGVSGGDQHFEMAERTTILRANTGSVSMGLNLPEKTPDRDEMGVCIEDYAAFAGFSEFEQVVYRSAAVREGTHDAKSQPGDLDLTIYSLKKYLRLALQGNPAVISLLYSRDLITSDARGLQLQELAGSIVSRTAGRRFLGYMEAQRQRLLGERGQKGVTRPDLVEKYGFDTKYAMHILRLGHQGIELLRDGKLTLPLEPSLATHIRSVRTGGRTLQEVLTEAGELERELKDLLTTSHLAEHPDRDTVESWMLMTYMNTWQARSSTNGSQAHLDGIERLASTMVKMNAGPKKLRAKKIEGFLVSPDTVSLSGGS